VVIDFVGDCSGLALAESENSCVFGAVAIEIYVLKMDSFFNPSGISTSSYLEA